PGVGSESELAHREIARALSEFEQSLTPFGLPATASGEQDDPVFAERSRRRAARSGGQARALSLPATSIEQLLDRATLALALRDHEHDGDVGGDLVESDVVQHVRAV